MKAMGIQYTIPYMMIKKKQKKKKKKNNKRTKKEKQHIRAQNEREIANKYTGKTDPMFTRYEIKFICFYVIAYVCFPLGHILFIHQKGLSFWALFGAGEAWRSGVRDARRTCALALIYMNHDISMAAKKRYGKWNSHLVNKR